MSSFKSEKDRLMECVPGRMSSYLGARLQYFFESGLGGSPIERMLLVALELEFRMTAWLCSECQNPSRPDVIHTALNIKERSPRIMFTISCQHHWRDYRVDIAIFYCRQQKPVLFVECDGHEFHERTPEQAERDRKRDRIIQGDGIPILRFTGREIYRDPFDCALQIADFLGERLPKLDQRAAA